MISFLVSVTSLLVSALVFVVAWWVFVVAYQVCEIRAGRLDRDGDDIIGAARWWTR